MHTKGREGQNWTNKRCTLTRKLHDVMLNNPVRPNNVPITIKTISEITHIRVRRVFH
jgi:hypothetical protein